MFDSATNTFNLLLSAAYHNFVPKVQHPSFMATLAKKHGVIQQVEFLPPSTSSPPAPTRPHLLMHVVFCHKMCANNETLQLETAKHWLDLMPWSSPDLQKERTLHEAGSLAYELGASDMTPLQLRLRLEGISSPGSVGFSADGRRVGPGGGGGWSASGAMEVLREVLKCNPGSYDHGMGWGSTVDVEPSEGGASMDRMWQGQQDSILGLSEVRRGLWQTLGGGGWDCGYPGKAVKTGGTQRGGLNGRGTCRRCTGFCRGESKGSDCSRSACYLLRVGRGSLLGSV